MPDMDEPTRGAVAALAVVLGGIIAIVLTAMGLIKLGLVLFS